MADLFAITEKARQVGQAWHVADLDTVRDVASVGDIIVAGLFGPGHGISMMAGVRGYRRRRVAAVARREPVFAAEPEGLVDREGDRRATSSDEMAPPSRWKSHAWAAPATEDDNSSTHDCSTAEPGCAHRVSAVMAEFAQARRSMIAASIGPDTSLLAHRCSAGRR